MRIVPCNEGRPPAMRIDKLLWFLRFSKSRSIAQAMATNGHIRLNGRRIEHAHQQVAAGDVLVLPLPSGVRVIEILALPVSRRPPREAQGCYRALDGGQEFPIAAPETNDAARGDLQP